MRTSGVGLASAISGVGAAIGTFLLPLSPRYLRLGWSMAAMAAVSLPGGVISLMWAPETSGRTLSETGARSGVASTARTLSATVP